MKKLRLAVGGVRVPQRCLAPSPARRKRPANSKPARTRHHGRPYSRANAVAADDTLIRRPAPGVRKQAVDDAWDRMRASDAARAQAVRHLIHHASRPTPAPAFATSWISQSGMSFDWWRYD